MSDGGFLQEQPKISPAASELRLGVVPSGEVPPAEAVSLPEGEDEVALAERQAAAQMAAEEETFLEQTEVGGGIAVPATSLPAYQPTSLQKDEVTVEVEKILEEGLGIYYQQMSEPAQMRFRQKGVEVSTQIANMVRSFHVQVKKVLHLIRDWLQTIPGVNRFFLEQEAKIKTDRMVELERARREDAQPKP